jgi:hypothetical protein
MDFFLPNQSLVTRIVVQAPNFLTKTKLSTNNKEGSEHLGQALQTPGFWYVLL